MDCPWPLAEDGWPEVQANYRKLVGQKQTSSQ